MAGAPAGGTAEPEPWYVDKLSGERRVFRPSPDEAVVTFPPVPEVEARPRIEAAPAVRSISQGINQARGVAAVWLAADARTVDRAQLVGVDDVMPVMVDGHGLPRYFIPGEVTVQFAAGVPAERAEEIIQQRGGTVAVRQRTPGYYTVRLPQRRDVFHAIRELSELPEVMFAEPSEIGFNDALQQRHLPDDPEFDRQWGLRNTGQVMDGVTGVAGTDIAATRAWVLHRGDPEVIIAVLDTGADLDHTDLAPRLLDRGAEDWNFADDDDPVPDDSGTHGTHVSGIAIAAENAFGIVGVAPRCRFMPLRLNLQSGVNQNRADAINYVTDQAAAHPHRRYVVNCSWRTSGDHAGIRNAVENAVRNGLVVVFAAGNANGDMDETPRFPASYPQVIAVAAIDNRNVRAWFSNFGGAVDVSAPGVEILSTMPDDEHDFESGTSMAAPHVSGVAALVWAAVPGLTNGEVRRIIEETCDDVNADNPDFRNRLGAGRVNAHRAVERAQFYGTYVPLLAPAFG